MSDQKLVPALIRRESGSFLQYVRESLPFAQGKDVPLRDAILRIAGTEAESAARLGRLAQRRGISAGPSQAPFPTAYTNSNFLAATALMPRLIQAERQAISQLDSELGQIADPEIRAQFESYRDMKRRHLAELESLVA